MLDDHPQELRLAFGEELPDQLIIVSLEIAEGQLNSLLIDVSQLADGLIVIFGDGVELSGGEVLVADEEIGEV